MCADHPPVDPFVIQSPTASEGPRLNLGCGTDIREGWINLDASHQIPGVDVVHDLEVRPFPFADEAVSFILAQDVLEHMTDAVATLRELHRILRPGGRVRIRVPHFTSRNNFIDPTHHRQFSIEWFDFFVQGTARKLERPYYFDFTFTSIAYEHITFENNFRWQFYNPLVDRLVNGSRKSRQCFETTLFRCLPADNVIIELQK